MALFDMSIFKTEKGVVRTQTLFYELSYSDLDYVVFTLKEHDTETTCGRPLKSLHRLFVDLTVADASEYTFAQYVFGSWDVWQKLQSSPMLQKHISKWRLEADVVVGNTGSIERILRGPAKLDDGTHNLLGCLKTSMGTLGAQTIKEMQQVEVVVAPSLLTEGKVYQKAQHLGMGK